MIAQQASIFSINLMITLRPLVPEDLPKLEWYGQYTHFRNVYARTYEEHCIGRRLMLVAVLNNFPIGQVFLHLALGHNQEKHKRGYLYALRVMEHLQGLGIGTRLIHYAEQNLIERDFEIAMISAAKTNIRARQLYERLGYHVIGEDEGRWQYMNHRGEVVQMHEPCWILEKNLR